jgi:putative transposase
VPEDVAELDLVMGRPDSRVLTHKGIELLGLFYNSSEVQDLRRRHGATLKVDIRVDESDIGYIFVIAPDSPQYFWVPALHSEYANGLSSWQHDLFRKQAREQMHENRPSATTVKISSEFCTNFMKSYERDSKSLRSTRREWLTGFGLRLEG